MTSQPLQPTEQALAEAHYRFGECVREYSDITRFTYALNATIQAARNVTFALQSEKVTLLDFEEWYEGSWRAYMGSVPLLRRLVEARNTVVKRGGLSVGSEAHMQLVDSYLEPSGAKRSVPPDMPLGAMTALALRGVPQERRRNAHLVVERRWVARDLDEGEVLHALARSIHVLDCLVDSARLVLLGHERLSPEDRVESTTPRSDLHLPCDFNRMRVDLETGHPASLTEARPPVIALSVEDLRSRYGESADSMLEVRRTDDPVAAAGILEAWVRSAMSVDGELMPVVLLHHPTRRPSWTTRVMIARNQADKYSLWQEIGREVSQEGYDGFVFVTEAWTVGLTPGEPPPVPPIKPSQRDGEILIIHGECSDGRRAQIEIPVERDPSGRPVLGESISTGAELEASSYAFPVRRAWGLDK